MKTIVDAATEARRKEALRKLWEAAYKERQEQIKAGRLAMEAQALLDASLPLEADDPWYGTG